MMPESNNPTPPGSASALDDSPVSQLRRECEQQQALLSAQSPIIQRFLEMQASQLADSLVQKVAQARFKLPDRVVCEVSPSGPAKSSNVPADVREQIAGGLMDRLTRGDIRIALRQRLAELEQHNNRAVAASAGLIRHATARYMIYNMLPAGRTVNYIAAEGEEIPSLPVISGLEPESAITAVTDAIAEEGGDLGRDQSGRGELLVPYVPAARRFYLPQWVAFDDQDHLLVNSVSEAEAHLASMQRFVEILHATVGLAPYMVADDQYQQKRYGMLGQLINQGRALARYNTREIIRTIQRRAAAHDLNRGLSLSLPYFDDQTLQMKTYFFEIIPAGRIMFVPAFVVRACQMEEVKVAQDTRLDPSTRKHLLAELKLLELAFISQ
jgi:hypothetical protein